MGCGNVRHMSRSYLEIRTRVAQLVERGSYEPNVVSSSLAVRSKAFSLSFLHISLSFSQVNTCSPGTGVHRDVQRLDGVPSWSGAPTLAELGFLTRAGCQRIRDACGGDYTAHDLIADVRARGWRVVSTWSSALSSKPYELRHLSSTMSAGSTCSWCTSPICAAMVVFSTDLGQVVISTDLGQVISLIPNPFQPIHKSIPHTILNSEPPADHLPRGHTMASIDINTILCPYIGNDVQGFLLTTGNELRENGYGHDAACVYKKLINVVEKRTNGEVTVALAEAFGLVGEALHDEFELMEAKEYLEKALSLWERLPYPNNNKAIATALNNLGLVLNALGEHHSAAALHERSYDLECAITGRDSPDKATGIYNLAAAVLCKGGQGDVKKAKGLYKQALAMRTRLYMGESMDPTDVAMADVAVSQAGLAYVFEVYYRNYREAEELLKIACSIMEQVFRSHPDMDQTDMKNIFIALPRVQTAAAKAAANKKKKKNKKKKDKKKDKKNKKVLVAAERVCLERPEWVQLCAYPNCERKATYGCGKCGGQGYCGREHQRADWKPKHKHECARSKVEVAAAKLLRASAVQGGGGE